MLVVLETPAAGFGDSTEVVRFGGARLRSAFAGITVVDELDEEEEML